jgi:hypothetical protein
MPKITESNAEWGIPMAWRSLFGLSNLPSGVRCLPQEIQGLSTSP